MIKVSVDTLAYEAVNKIFRNAVVGHLRLRLSAALGPDAWGPALESLLVKEWENIKRSAGSAEVNAVLERGALDNADLLSVNHFYIVFDKFFLDLVDPRLRPDGNALKPFKNALLSSFREIKAVRDPISHPPETDLSPFDALQVVFNAGRVLRLLDLQQALNELKDVRQELARRAAGTIGDLPLSPGGRSSVLSSLPPREEMVDEFVGRSAELERLWEWLVDPAAGRWVLVGEGGKGKSTVAYQFGNSVRFTAAEDLIGVFWLSAKRRLYAESEVREIESPDFHDLDSALNKLLGDYGYASDVDKSVDAKRAQVLEMMKALPALIIVDDLDSIDADAEEVVEFFTYDAPRTGSKILITSRRQYPGMARCSTQVAGLPPDDASAFLQATVTRLGLGHITSLPARFPKIVEVTEGSPLYMEDLLRLCRMHPPDRAIERWRQEAGDASRRYALQRERELLSSLAADALDACCLAGVGLSVAQLQRILNKPEIEVEGALRELEAAFLVPGAVLTDDVLTFRVSRNLESMARRDLRRDPARLPLRNAVDAVVGNRRGRVDDKAEDYRRQIRVLVSGRKYPEALATAESALAEFPNDAELLGAQALAFSKSIPTRIADARSAWSRSAQLAGRSQQIYVEWSNFEADRNDWARSAAAAQEGLTHCGRENYELLRLAGYGTSRLGQMQARQLDTQQAEQSLARAKELLKQALKAAQVGGAEDAVIGRTYRALVLNAQAMRDGHDIVYFVKEWLEWKPSDLYAQEECRRQADQYSELRGLAATLEG